MRRPPYLFPIFILASLLLVILAGGCSFTVREQPYLADLDKLLGDDADAHVPKRITKMVKAENSAYKKVYDTNFVLIRRRSPSVPEPEIDELENMKWSLAQMHTATTLSMERLRQLFQENALLQANESDEKGINLPNLTQDKAELESVVDKNMARFEANHKAFMEKYQAFRKKLAASKASDGGLLMRQLLF